VVFRFGKIKEKNASGPGHLNASQLFGCNGDLQ